MIFTGTTIYVGDNSGAIKSQVIKIVSRSKYRWGQIGDVALVTVKKIRPRKKIKKSEKCRLIVANSRTGVKRIGQTLTFSVNAGIILKKDDPVPIGSRVHLSIPFEVRQSGYRRVLTMSSVNL
jgi:ribosomal protein L14